MHSLPLRAPVLTWHCLPMTAAIALMLVGCSPDPAPPPAAPPAPPPPSQASAPGAVISGDKVISTEGGRQMIFSIGGETTNSFAVFVAAKNPGYPFTAWLTALDSPLYRDLAAKITNFDPMAPGTSGFNAAHARLVTVGIMATEPEVVTKFKELLAKGSFSPKPQIMRVTGNALTLDQYTENGLRMILPGGIPEEHGILVKKVELYAK